MKLSTMVEQNNNYDKDTIIIESNESPTKTEEELIIESAETTELDYLKELAGM